MPLKRPAPFIGAVKTVQNKRWVFDDQAELKTVFYNPGLFGIVREIASNAIDNVWRTKEFSPDSPMKKIEIFIDTEIGEISISNDGYCIPVKKEEVEYTDHKTGKSTIDNVYPAESLFGDMFSGTNYDDEKPGKTSGTHGIGAKATNIFSKRFVVEHASYEDQQSFMQIYTDNGKSRTEPKVNKYRKKSGFTKITFVPDWKYFKYPNTKAPGIDENFIGIIKMYAHEIAMITKLTVNFTVDGKLSVIRTNTLEKYSRLFYPAPNKLVIFNAPNGDECVLVEGHTPEADILPEIPHISFVNGIRTRNGGIHVDAWRDSIISTLVKAFNTRKGSKKKGPSVRTTAKELYPYFQLFVRVEVDGPKFDSNVKNELTELRNASDKSIPYKLFNARSKNQKGAWSGLLEDNVKKIMTWNFIGHLEDKILSKIDRKIASKESSSKSSVNLGQKGDDAYKAGGKESMNCTLYITEGLSAKAFAFRGISSTPNGQAYNGTYAVKGKFVNAKKHSARMVNDNEEVQLLKKVLGLRRGADYSKDEVYETMRYGEICILTDADDDGIHIRGLLLNYFETEFPGLIARGIVHSFSTAVATATFKKGKGKGKGKKGSTPLLFYSNPEFKKWYGTQEKASLSSFNVQYYKGLGSINPRDTPGYFKNPKIVSYFIEKDAVDLMNLGFSSDKQYIAERKTWLTKRIKKPDDLDIIGEEEEELIMEDSESDEDEFVYEGQLSLNSFVDDQLVIYHRMALRRCLPGVWDGLKESQRKILFGILSKNYKRTNDLEKVMGAVKESTGYHHGGVSLTGAITKMAQGFVGTNNIPLLENDGEFGTRYDSGADAAAPRYIKTMIENITRAIFPVEDDNLFEQMYEDNEPVEYKFFMPIIPMILVNGSEGIASGFSTKIPCYNPLDIVRWVEAWMNGKSDALAPLVPWYRGYKGEITLVKEKKNKPPTRWLSKGILEKGTGSDKGWWHIRELPIGIGTNKFKEYLEDLQTASKGKPRAISKIRKKCTPNTVHFMIKPTKDFLPSMNVAGNFKILQKTASLENMIAIDENDYPIRFSTPEAILRYFCMRRLDYYARRRDYFLRAYEKDLTKATNKYRFVKGVVDKKLDLNQPADDEELDKLLSGEEWKLTKIQSGKDKSPSFDYLLSMQMRSLTVKKLNDLEKEAEALEHKIHELTNKSPKAIWREDLQKFNTAYKKFLKTRVEE